jgi:hypothetical protein
MTLGTSMAARHGPVAMAAHQICLQVWLAVSLLTDALAASGQVLYHPLSKSMFIFYLFVNPPCLVYFFSFHFLKLVIVIGCLAIKQVKPIKG